MDDPRGPVDGRVVPRFAGPPTFARLPRRDEVADCDVAIVGVPFDSGVTYRPGARFGPAAIRHGSRLLRPYHQDMKVEPFALQQVADAGDIACNPFVISEAISEIDAAAGLLLEQNRHLIALGGDHTIALPLLRAARRRFGSVASTLILTLGKDTSACRTTMEPLFGGLRRKACFGSIDAFMSEYAGRFSAARIWRMMQCSDSRWSRRWTSRSMDCAG